MTVDEDAAADLAALGDRLEENRGRIDALREERERLHADRRDIVVDALYGLQDALDEDEEVVLIAAEEWSRGGHYVYDQVLTADGVVADDVERVFRGHGVGYEDGEKVLLDDDDVDEEYEIRGEDKYRDASPGEMYGWPAGDEPLDIAEDYLSGRRDTPTFIGTLADRVQALAAGEDRVPSHGQGYD